VCESLWFSARRQTNNLHYPQSRRLVAALGHTHVGGNRHRTKKGQQMSEDNDEVKRQARAIARRIEEEEKDKADKDLGEANLGARKLETLQAKLEALGRDYGVNADRTYEPEMAILVTMMHTGTQVLKWTRDQATLIGWFEDGSPIVRTPEVDEACAATVRNLIRNRRHTGAWS
jgi:hypothetical protein